MFADLVGFFVSLQVAFDCNDVYLRCAFYPGGRDTVQIKKMCDFTTNAEVA